MYSIEKKKRVYNVQFYRSVLFLVYYENYRKRDRETNTHTYTKTHP